MAMKSRMGQTVDRTRKNFSFRGRRGVLTGMAHRLFWLFASCAVPAFAQVHVDVQVALPTIVFPAPPPLVVVEPGVQVVADLDDRCPPFS
jgi:hypothetical protein